MASKVYYANGGGAVYGDSARYVVNSTFNSLSTGSGNSYHDASYINVYVKSGVTNFDWITRSFLAFNTSDLSGANITSVVLTIYPVFKSQALGAWTLDVNRWAASTAVDKIGNYQEMDKATTYGSVDYGDIVFSETDIDLSLASVNTTGKSTFALAVDWDTDTSFGGTWVTESMARVIIYTSTDHYPKLTVTYKETLERDIDAEFQFESSSSATVTHYATANAELEFEARVNANLLEQQTIEKGYEYKVYDKSGVFVGTWKDVITDPTYSQQINTPGASMNVGLARSPDYTKATFDDLYVDTAEGLVDDTLDQYIVPGASYNAVGAGTDVSIGYRVKVYLYYGSLEAWVDDGSDPMTDDTGDGYVFGLGAPNGRVLFDGYIDNYDLKYGASGGVAVSLISHGADMSKEVIMSGTATTVAYNSYDPSNIMKGILDDYGGLMTYGADSIDLTSTTTSYTFKLNSVLDGAKKSVQLAPSGWYWYGDVGSNLVTMKEKATTPHHTFKLGSHISTLSLKKSMSNMVNKVYFVGAETAGVAMFRTYSDATSITTYGEQLEVLTDNRVTLTATADTISNNLIADKKDPEWVSTIVIPDGVYDIYSIKLGEIIGFEGFGTFVDDVTMQVAGLSLERDEITLTLGSNVPEQRKRIEEINRNEREKASENVPSTPS